MSLKVNKAAGALGAFCEGVGIEEAIADPSLFVEIQQLLHQHQVIFLPEQHVEPSALEKFASLLGPAMEHEAYDVAAGTQHVQILESTAEKPSKIEVWHSDMTFAEAPPAYTLLHGQILPEYGGDTLWASAQAAYENLTDAMRRLVDDLIAVHDFRQGFAESLAEPGGEERLAEAIANNPPIEHPVVRTHPVTGAKSIYVNALFTARIKDLTAFESARLLEFLYGHIVTEEHTVRLSWRPQMVAIWDNCATQHKPINDFFPQHRRMHRVTIAGSRPE